MMKKLFILTSILVAIAFLTASATIINVPEDYETIQQGIDASTDGDTVLVADGHYYERINFYGKGILLTSEFMLDGDTLHIQNTIIDADTSVLGVADTGSVVCFVNGEDSTSVIIGFTIQNGIGTIYVYSVPLGGGIYCDGSFPLISSNTIARNSAAAGGGICCFYNSSPIISNNKIKENSSVYEGGGIACWHDSSPTIMNNIISENYSYYKGGGIMCSNSSTSLIANNLIIGNSVYGNGGGIYVCCSNPIINNNTISENYAEAGGGILVCQTARPIIFNTIFWGDSASNGINEIYMVSDFPNITYCNIQDTLWPGEGNIDVDPLFRDPEIGDFHLMATYCDDPYNSPCIDAGHPDLLDSLLDCEWGLGELRSDMGAYGGGDIAVDIDEPIISIPKMASLSQNYPNPFNASTVIRYNLPEPSAVTINIYDILGRKVETLKDGAQPAGAYSIIWIADEFSSGIYFCKFQAGDFTETRKMILLK